MMWQNFGYAEYLILEEVRALRGKVRWAFLYVGDSSGKMIPDLFKCFVIP